MPGDRPDLVAHAVAVSGLNHMFGAFAFGTLASAAAFRLIEPFDSEVIPRARERMPGQAAMNDVIASMGCLGRRAPGGWSGDDHGLAGGMTTAEDAPRIGGLIERVAIGDSRPHLTGRGQLAQGLEAENAQLR